MNKELFELKVIYFGLCNLLRTFQQMTNSIFQELLYEGVLANNIDDFVILAKEKNQKKEQYVSQRQQRNITSISNSQSTTLRLERYPTQK